MIRCQRIIFPFTNFTASCLQIYCGARLGKNDVGIDFVNFKKNSVPYHLLNVTELWGLRSTHPHLLIPLFKLYEKYL